MTTIDPSLYLKSQQQPRGTTNSSLGKDDFMRILMAQLQNQDPLNPMKDKEFISQMTSFSSLEQMMNMSTAIEKMTQSQAQSFSPVVKYSAMIGKQVSYQVIDEDTGNVSNVATSLVSAVSQKDGNVLLELNNGEKIGTNEIVRVSEPTG